MIKNVTNLTIFLCLRCFYLTLDVSMICIIYTFLSIADDLIKSYMTFCKPAGYSMLAKSGVCLLSQIISSSDGIRSSIKSKYLSKGQSTSQPGICNSLMVEGMPR